MPRVVLSQVVSAMTGNNTRFLFAISVLVVLAVYYYGFQQSDDSNDDEIRSRIEKYVQLMEKVGGSKDGRPESCITDVIHGLRPNLGQIAVDNPTLKVAIVIGHPYSRTLSSVILTTNSIADIVLVANGAKEADSYRDVLEEMAANNLAPRKKFLIVEVSPSRKETIFQEMLEIANKKLPSYDVVVFLLAKMSCTLGWLEALLLPFLSRHHQPLIVSPYFDDIAGRISSTQIWWQFKKNKSDWDDKVDATLAFLPDAFAINRKSPNFVKMVSFLRDNKINDATTLDVAMFAWRCLNFTTTSAPAVVMAPCSRLFRHEHPDDRPSGDGESESRMLKKKKEQTKKRVAEMWFSNISVQTSAPTHRFMKSIKNNIRTSCRTFTPPDIDKEQGVDELLTAIIII